MTKLTTRAQPARGIKRWCRACELPFYDLTKSPVICPNCADSYVPEETGGIIDVMATPVATYKGTWRARGPQPPSSPVAETAASDEQSGTENEDNETELKDDNKEDDAVVVQADDTLLEEEADEDDLSIVVGGPATGSDEQDR